MGWGLEGLRLYSLEILFYEIILSPSYSARIVLFVLPVIPVRLMRQLSEVLQPMPQFPRLSGFRRS